MHATLQKCETLYSTLLSLINVKLILNSIARGREASWFFNKISHILTAGGVILKSMYQCSVCTVEIHLTNLISIIVTRKYPVNLYCVIF